MTDRPIIFSAPMIRALLAGRKTQTRRVLKPQPPGWATFCQQPSMLNVLHQWVPSGLWRWSEPEQKPPRPLLQWPIDAEGSHYWLRPPHAKGDRLWVKENWRTSAGINRVRPSKMETPGCGYGWPIWYGADDGAVTWRGAQDGGPGFITPGKSRPSIFLPRWASRLTLVVSDVRVERLHSITEKDAIAEGAEQYASSTKVLRAWDPALKGSYRAGFLALWDRLHSPEATDANPWVYAITFEAVRANIDTLPARAAAGSTNAPEPAAA